MCQRREEEAIRMMAGRLGYLSRRYAHRNAPAEDLYQEAAIGVVLACRDYQEQAGAFVSYAYHRARGRVLHYLRDKSHIIKPPAGAYERKELPMLLPVELDALRPSQQESLIRPIRDWTNTLIEAISQEPERTNHRLQSVTARQIEVLKMLTKEEMSTAEASDRLCVSKRTIDFHLQIIYRNWGVSSIIQAYNEAMRRGLIEPPARTGL